MYCVHKVSNIFSDFDSDYKWIDRAILSTNMNQAVMFSCTIIAYYIVSFSKKCKYINKIRELLNKRSRYAALTE